MEFIKTNNNRPVKLKDIPLLSKTGFTEAITACCLPDKRPIAFFAVDERTSTRIFCALADDKESSLYITSTLLNKNEHTYESLTPIIPAFHLLEREIYEEFGVLPEGHPYLKPVRYSFNRYNHEDLLPDFPFFHIEGEEVHEVGVGPIHAGVIEPGHFRFNCQGETVHNLEIQLGFQHRGVERLFIQPGASDSYKLCLAESIAGDTVIGHTSAYAFVTEGLMQAEIPLKAAMIRAISLEMERMAIHIGDLAALSNDVAYLTGLSFFGGRRTMVINTMLTLCGSRFGRNLIKPGGVFYDMNETLVKSFKKTVTQIKNEIELACDVMFSSSSVLSRFEDTGIVSREAALSLGLTGPAARASGVSVDARTDHPIGAYKLFPLYKNTLETGDVFARAYIRYIEIGQSAKLILELLDQLSGDSIYKKSESGMTPDSFNICMVEAWRGETVHCALTDHNGNLSRYKIKDPSFSNWIGLSLAVKNNGISDFPLCNKSFNLSYCGFDL